MLPPTVVFIQQQMDLGAMPDIPCQLLTKTKSFIPSNDRAPPILPFTQIGPLVRIPSRSFPLESEAKTPLG